MGTNSGTSSHGTRVASPGGSDDSTVASTLRIPNDLAFVEPLLAYVTTLMAGSAFSERETSQVRLALEEAVTNVIKHGFEPGQRATIEIVVETGAEGLVLVLRDQGLPFDPSRLPQYQPEKAQDDLCHSGLGTYLMRHSVDEVVYENLGREGKQIRLGKFPAASRVDVVSTTEHLARYAELPASSVQAAQAPIEIRPLRDEEAIEVSRCAYRAYGYTYEDYIYYPEQIVALNRKGLLHSLVAVAPGGEIAGHIALKRERETGCVAEVGVAMVVPKFRGGGTLGRLTEAIDRKAEDLGLQGVFLRAVTSHHRSQRACYAVGYRPCGILLAMFPANVDFKQLTEVVCHRENALMAYRGLSPGPGATSPRKVWLPARHHAMVATIYRWLDLAVEIAEPPPLVASGQDDEHAQVAVKTSAVLRAVRMVARAPGPDLEHAVRSGLRYACLQRFDVIYLLVDLQEPRIASHIPAFEGLGFFFAGMLPHCLDDHDALVLQYLNNVAIDYDDLQPWSQEGRDLAAYVRSQDPGLTS